MKKAFIALLCAGTLVFAQHPFNTDGAVLLDDREAEVEISGGSDFVSERTGNVKIGLAYGIGNRFQIGMNNYWYDYESSSNFAAPDLTMKLSIRPDFIAIKAVSSLNAEEFGGFLLYTIKLKKMQTALNFDVGFVSDGAEKNAFSWNYSIVQPLSKSFFGAEIYGAVDKDWDKDAKKPLWQIGLGHNFGKKRMEHIASIGFGGSFVSNDDLYITLGVTKFFSANE